MLFRNDSSLTLPSESDGVTRKVNGPRTSGGTSTAHHTTVANEVKMSNPQGVVNEENPTIREMAQNANPSMQTLAGILQTQTRPLEGITHGGGLSQNIRGGEQSGVVGNRLVVTQSSFKNRDHQYVDG